MTIDQAEQILPRAAGGSQPPRPPKPPRRPPEPPKPPIELSRRETILRSVIAIIAIMLLSFGINLLLFSHVQYLSHQQQLTDHFRAQLAEGVAPVSEGDVDDVLLPDGAPVAVLTIPSIGLRTVVVEGTSSGDLMMGPGHRRDTALPGQAGVSVIMGRASAYGAPFSRIQDLQPGDTFTATTGQGEHTFEVMGLRYAGDPSPAPITAGESRIVLETARGLPYAPTGVARIDARLVGEALPNGARQTNFMTLPPEDTSLATDTTTVWALVFALQVLIVAEIALIWSVRRVGTRQAWTVFLPVVLLTGLIITDQVMRLLPNLL
ncbi:sortase [Leucobacter sp. Z1108]|uniref:sortase n=1 Tax=Leucobacter sp. Z1108 TaxID=3439066 RepID=UPI003F2F88D5